MVTRREKYGVRVDGLDVILLGNSATQHPAPAKQSLVLLLVKIYLHSPVSLGMQGNVRMGIKRGNQARETELDRNRS